MPVFMAASDESSGANHRSKFLYCGFLAPIDEWTQFTEEWDKRVLSGPPRIPYLHMTEIRSRKWRELRGLSESEAERRVDEATALISATTSLIPVGSTLNSGHLRDTFTQKIVVESGARKAFASDYLAFVTYVFSVLMFCHIARPEAEKVNFIVEKNGEITDYIKEFYKGMALSLEYIERPDLISLLGDLIPAGKDCIPLQAADVLCWHTQRSAEGTLDANGIKRYAPMANRKGAKFDYEDSDIRELWANVNQE